MSKFPFSAGLILHCNLHGPWMCFIFVYPLPLGPGCTSFYAIRDDLTMDSHFHSAALSNRAVIA